MGIFFPEFENFFKHENFDHHDVKVFQISRFKKKFPIENFQIYLANFLNFKNPPPSQQGNSLKLYFSNIIKKTVKSKIGSILAKGGSNWSERTISRKNFWFWSNLKILDI